MPKKGETKYTVAMSDRLCLTVAEGGTLKKACENEGISRDTFYRWKDKYQYLSDSYARARIERTHNLIDSISDLDAKLLAGKIDPQTHRQLVDSLKWQICKLNPRDYGDRMQIDQDHNITIDVVQYLPEKCINRDTPNLIRDTSENS